MLSQNRTIYQTLPRVVSEDLLTECYLPSNEELSFSHDKTLNSHNQLLFLLSFKLYQNLGYFIKLKDCPSKIIEYYADILKITAPNSEDLAFYDTTSQKDRYCAEIRKQFKAKLFNNKVIYKISLKIAETKNSIVDIINGTIETLINDYYELPSFSMLEKLAIKAKSEINNGYYEQIYNRMPQSKINTYLKEVLIYGSDGKSIWNALKTEPDAPSINNLQRFFEHFKNLKSLCPKQKVFDDIPYSKLEVMFDEGVSQDFYKIKRIRVVKRIALVAIVIKMLTIRATDDLVDMFIRLVFNMRSDSINLYNKFKLDKIAIADKLINKFGVVIKAYNNNLNKKDRLKIVEAEIKDESEELQLLYDEYNTNVNSFIYFMEKKLTTKLRSTLISMLGLIEFDIISKNRDVLDLVEYVIKTNNEVKIISNDNLPKQKISKRWKNICKLSKNEFSRARLDIYVFLTLCDSLKSREVFIKDAYKYSDYRASLISWKLYDQKIEEYEKITALSPVPSTFCAGLKSELRESSYNATNNFSDRGKTSIIKGKLRLKKIIAEPTADGVAELDAHINKNLKEISLLDVITYSCKSLKLQEIFAPLSGVKIKTEEHLKHVVATLFCYGCNITASEGERSIVDINRKHIGKINSMHISEAALEQAICYVVNTYNKFQLTNHWGNGKHVSVDGTKWETYKKNLTAQYHIRYRGYGGIAYYHVSDKYIATYSNFISCGVHESRFLLDGIECNESDIKPEFVHGDNHAQSLVVYGLSYLLGIKIMPRVKNINNLIFYKVNSKDNFGEIDSLFSGKTINWKLIHDYTKEMFRVALSIKEGKVKPSEILNRISSSHNQNKLYIAFRELGRVVRTSYILNYISDFDLRRIVHAATCKSEEFNDYVGWIAFASEKIKQNNRLEQRKFIKYNHLVTNMVFLYNVKEMSRAINNYIKSGNLIDNKVLSSLSPYRKSHIMRLGRYELDLDQPGTPIDNWQFNLD